MYLIHEVKTILVFIGNSQIACLISKSSQAINPDSLFSKEIVRNIEMYFCYLWKYSIVQYTYHLSVIYFLVILNPFVAFEKQLC